MYETQTHLRHLVKEAAAGNGFLICKTGKPMARVIPIQQNKPPTARHQRLRRPEGQCSVPDDFDHLSNKAIADLFEDA